MRRLSRRDGDICRSRSNLLKEKHTTQKKANHIRRTIGLNHRAIGSNPEATAEGAATAGRLPLNGSSASVRKRFPHTQRESSMGNPTPGGQSYPWGAILSLGGNPILGEQSYRDRDVSTSRARSSDTGGSNRGVVCARALQGHDQARQRKAGKLWLCGRQREQEGLHMRYMFAKPL